MQTNCCRIIDAQIILMEFCLFLQGMWQKIKERERKEVIAPGQKYVDSGVSHSYATIEPVILKLEILVEVHLNN